MNRYFVDIDLQVGSFADLSKESFQHIIKANRMRVGELIELSAPSGVYTCEILTDTMPFQVKVLEASNKSNESKMKVTLYQGLAKGDKMETIIQKAVELGVYRIVPFNSSRTIVRLNKEKFDKKRERYEAIVRSAAEQSKRDNLPEIGELIDIEDIDGEDLFIAYEEDTKPLKDLLKEFSKKEMGIVVGPEGGLAKDEVEALIAKGARSFSLGPRILRTETAGPSLLSIIQYELGDMGE